MIFIDLRLICFSTWPPIWGRFVYRGALPKGAIVEMLVVSQSDAAKHNKRIRIRAAFHWHIFFFTN